MPSRNRSRHCAQVHGGQDGRSGKGGDSAWFHGRDSRSALSADGALPHGQAGLAVLSPDELAGSLYEVQEGEAEKRGADGLAHLVDVERRAP